MAEPSQQEPDNLVDLGGSCDCGHLFTIHDSIYGCTFEVGKIIRGFGPKKKPVFERVYCVCKTYISA